MKTLLTTFEILHFEYRNDAIIENSRFFWATRLSSRNLLLFPHLEMPEWERAYLRVSPSGGVSIERGEGGEGCGRL